MKIAVEKWKFSSFSLFCLPTANLKRKWEEQIRQRIPIFFTYASQFPLVILGEFSSHPWTHRINYGADGSSYPWSAVFLTTSFCSATVKNEDGIIIEDSNVWVNTNKTILEERFVKISYSDLPKDYNYLKFIWIHTKKEDRVLIKNCSREYKETNSSINS